MLALNNTRFRPALGQHNNTWACRALGYLSKPCIVCNSWASLVIRGSPFFQLHGPCMAMQVRGVEGILRQPYAVGIPKNATALAARLSSAMVRLMQVCDRELSR